jgi:transcriptional regulator with XRE-family HTH domain
MSQKVINNLEHARRTRGLSRKQVASVLEVLGYRGTSALEEYELGRSWPPLRTALAISILYRSSITTLWSEPYRLVAEQIEAAEERLAGGTVEVPGGDHA